MLPCIGHGTPSIMMGFGQQEVGLTGESTVRRHDVASS